MSKVGDIERITQNRVVKLFKDTLGYTYLGDWQDRPDNRNIEREWLIPFLQKQGYNEDLINRALHKLEQEAQDQSRNLYDRNRAVYGLLRYGVKVKPDVGEHTETVWLIDWDYPENNDFAIAEEVTVIGTNNKRPDVVLYVNGIALGVIELKRSTISVTEGIRQNLDNQKKEFIEHYFSTMQLVKAGNDTQGLRYGTIETPEKYYLTWKEESSVENPLDRDLLLLCEKSRFLEMIHDYIVFDAGTKKICRHHQYFGVRAAQEFVKRREGGIIWHTQGSGKSLVMVWLAKWLRENRTDARVLIITDRKELDEQIEGVFTGIDEKIYRTNSGADLISCLNAAGPSLMCSLVHKFGRMEEGVEVGEIDEFIKELKKSLPKDFKAKGDLYVFVDECHRTQSGELHKAMKTILPSAMFVGFTGTPLLKADKKSSIEIFGRYIHTYRYDEAVKDGVVLDLHYEARDIDQNIAAQDKIDLWFESKTRGLTDLAKAKLKKRWGTMQKVLSCKDRLEKIVADVLMDIELNPRLQSGRGNVMIVTSSIYEACKLFEMFDNTDLAGKCAIVTSYQPTTASIKGEETGEGETEKLRKYAIYKKMLADWFNEDPETAVHKADKFDEIVKYKFVHEPAQMKLLIVVDKLLTGFDAPPATYLYIDKNMQDHGLFQAICRVNRLDGEDKDYGYIIDYKDLFKSLEGAFNDYTSGAFEGYDREDVEGLLTNRLIKAKERLDDACETVLALCEPVQSPKNLEDYTRYFCARESGNAEQLKQNEPNRVALYKHVASFIRAYANLANELSEAGYTDAEIQELKKDVNHFENMRSSVMLSAGDYIDLKRYEPAMRNLIDMYIRAEDSQKISSFEDMSLVELLVERGEQAIEQLPEGIRKNKKAVAETIENNVRKLIINEQPINPKYFEKMSELLDALIDQRRRDALDYKEYLAQIVELSKKVKDPSRGEKYPMAINSAGLRALYDNFGRDESLAVSLNHAVLQSRQDDWRNNSFKVKKVFIAIKEVVDGDADRAQEVMDLVTNQNEY